MIDKIYPESVEESGNYLRMTLKNISENKLPYNPISYSLWYDYATGRNEQLIEDIESFSEEQENIQYQTIADLFKKHIADNQLLLAEKKTKEFQKILAEMVNQMYSSEEDIDTNGSILDALSSRLSEASSIDVIGKIANQIVDQTSSLVASSKVLSKQIKSKLNEIRELRKELEGIKKTAKTDILTGLLNRRGFEEAMIHILEDANVSEHPLSIIMIDIDHFKMVNDQHGHLVGDNVLKMLSKILKDNIKGRDVASRYGGDEFIVALAKTDEKGALIVAEYFRNNLRKMNWKIKGTGESIGQISISLGVAVYQKGDSLEQTIGWADNALYQSKHSGRNKISTIKNK